MPAKEVSIGPFVGINNRVPDHQLAIVERGRKAGDYVRNAVNVDLTQAGTLQRREGTELKTALTGAHSLWAHDDGAYCVAGTTLYAIDRHLSPTAVKTDMVPGMRVSFAAMPNGDVYWSSEVANGRIRNGVNGPAGVGVPNPAPTVTAATGGALPAGKYQIAITAAPDGVEESGATWPVQVDVPEGGSITIADMPSGMKNIYMTTQNGDLLGYVLSTTATSYVLAVMLVGLGPQLQTLGMQPLPPGHIVAHFRGRRLVASGSTLVYSEPHAYGLYNPMRDYIPFPARITIVAPVEGGVYVVADKTYWLAGEDIDKARVVTLLPYGAVEGTTGTMDTSTDVWWFSDRGVVVGDTQGQVKNIQEETVAVESAQAGATLYREQDGQRRLVTSLLGTDASTGAANSFMDAEIIRKDNML